jgi:hypothetical protein
VTLKSEELSIGEPPLSKLREYLCELPAGMIDDKSRLIALLSECWDDFEGASAEATSVEKLRRAESVDWNPPLLTFVIERHGGTVQGSTRAQLHRWTIDLNRITASCDPSYSSRQLYSRDAPLRIEPLVSEVTEHIIGRHESEKLKWLSDGSTVRILVTKFINGQFQQTEQSRRQRFRKALDRRLQAAGWTKVVGKLDVYRRATST